MNVAASIDRNHGGGGLEGWGSAGGGGVERGKGKDTTAVRTQTQTKAVIIRPADFP